MEEAFSGFCQMDSLFRLDKPKSAERSEMLLSTRLRVSRLDKPERAEMSEMLLRSRPKFIRLDKPERAEMSEMLLAPRYSPFQVG